MGYKKRQDTRQDRAGQDTGQNRKHDTWQGKVYRTHDRTRQDRTQDRTEDKTGQDRTQDKREHKTGKDRRQYRTGQNTGQNTRQTLSLESNNKAVLLGLKTALMIKLFPLKQIQIKKISTIEVQ